MKPEPLTDADHDMIVEALFSLKGTKEAALHAVNGHLPKNARPFTPHDFGIPHIDRLIARFSEECERCTGTGCDDARASDPDDLCPDCKGKGRVAVEIGRAAPPPARTRKCPMCGRTHAIEKDVCECGYPWLNGNKEGAKS